MSQIRLAKFQLFSNHMWHVAAALLDSKGLEHQEELNTLLLSLNVLLFTMNFFNFSNYKIRHCHHTWKTCSCLYLHCCSEYPLISSHLLKLHASSESLVTVPPLLAASHKHSSFSLSPSPKACASLLLSWALVLLTT